MLKIYFSNNSDLIELECIERGCRLDVLVEIDGNYYEPLITTIERPEQEVDDAFKNGNVYDIDPAQIIVKEANNAFIIESIIELHKRGFFTYFYPVDLKEHNKTNAELADFHNCDRVYYDITI